MFEIDRTPESIRKKEIEARKILSEIIKGYSPILTKEFGNIFIKHLGIVDSASSEIMYEVFYQRAIDCNIPSYESVENDIIKSKKWSKEKDVKIRDLSNYVKNMTASRTKMIRQSDIDNIDKEIFRVNDEILDLKNEKSYLIGNTAENYANNKVNEYYLMESCYSDEKLSSKKFTKKEFDELDNDDISIITDMYNKRMSVFNIRNIQKISLSPIFNNLFSLCNDDACKFYGRNICDLTFFQADLFSSARYFMRIIEESKVKPSQELYDDPDRLIDYLTVSRNANSIMEKSGKHINKKKTNNNTVATSIVGATESDLKKAGIADKNDTISLKEVLKKNGGKTMSMKELIDSGLF